MDGWVTGRSQSVPETKGGKGDQNARIKRLGFVFSSLDDSVNMRHIRRLWSLKCGVQRRPKMIYKRAQDGRVVP